jgi:hypothetical protein
MSQHCDTLSLCNHQWNTKSRSWIAGFHLSGLAFLLSHLNVRTTLLILLRHQRASSLLYGDNMTPYICIYLHHLVFFYILLLSIRYAKSQGPSRISGCRNEMGPWSKSKNILTNPRTLHGNPSFVPLQINYLIGGFSFASLVFIFGFTFLPSFQQDPQN